MQYEKAKGFPSIKGKIDLDKIFREGGKLRCGALTLFSRTHEGKNIRVCAVVPKNLGNAPQRNKVRRIIKEEIRKKLPRGDYGLDIAIIYKGKIVSDSSPRLRKNLNELIQRFTRQCLE